MIKFIRYPRNRKYYAPNSGMGYVNLDVLHLMFERGDKLVVRDADTNEDVTELTRIRARHQAELSAFKKGRAA